MTARTSRSRVQALRLELSTRDTAILDDLGRVRLLTASQIQRLHFADGTTLSRSRRTARVCKRLADLGAVARLDRRVGGVHAGSAGFIYCLDSLGQTVIDAKGPAGGNRRRRPWQPSPMFQDHVLEVAELYVALREAARHGDVELLGFDAEPACWRPFVTPAAGAVVLKPDAYVRLGVGEYEQVSFVEIDRGTHHAPALGRKLAVYTAAFTAGVEHDQNTAFPNVLWIVPDQARARVLRSQIARLPAHHRDLFEVTTSEHQLNPLKGGTP